MKKLMLLFSVALLLVSSAVAQSKPAELEQVLDLLDRVSASFKSVQADFVWDQYQKLVDEHDLQRGVTYFKRSGPSVDVAADITSPYHKKLVFRNGEVQVYSFKTGEVERKDTSKSKQTVESFLALGFGGRGHDLTRNFDVSYAGTETVDGAMTYKLVLIPKTQEGRNMFPRITLWINQKTGMSEMQRLDQGEGDYRVATFTNIKVNQKLPGDAFDLKAQ